MKILSLFTHRHVVFNMYVFLSSVKHDFFFLHVLVTNISQISTSAMFTESHSDLEPHEGE